jgi:RNA polymerase sigma factor (TIGR02999 family)
MPVESTSQLSVILGRARTGDEAAKGELLGVLYNELRRVASRIMRHERPDHTLSPTAVVNEAVIKLLREPVLENAPDRNFLVASAARAMREVLIDHARHRSASRRGGGRKRVPLDSVVDYFDEQGLDIVAVHEALDRLGKIHERAANVMTLRYFGGLTVPEVAAALDVSVVTVERDWRLARAWLGTELQGVAP